MSANDTNDLTIDLHAECAALAESADVAAPVRRGGNVTERTIDDLYSILDDPRNGHRSDAAPVTLTDAEVVAVLMARGGITPHGIGSAAYAIGYQTRQASVYRADHDVMVRRVRDLRTNRGTVSTIAHDAMVRCIHPTDDLPTTVAELVGTVRDLAEYAFAVYNAAGELRTRGAL